MVLGYTVRGSRCSKSKGVVGDPGVQKLENARRESLWAFPKVHAAGDLVRVTFMARRYGW
jgi:hypothetical protein